MDAETGGDTTRFALSTLHKGTCVDTTHSAVSTLNCSSAEDAGHLRHFPREFVVHTEGRGEAGYVRRQSVAAMIGSGGELPDCKYERGSAHIYYSPAV